MRYALIDNSTLTAVQRLLGEISIQNKHVIDGDIMAFENLLQAILFYDKIFYLDDYKEQYRYSRREYFKTILPLVPSEIGYKELIREAKGITEGIIPCVEGGKFTDDDFAPFFKQLRMNVLFNWEMSSSSYFLNVKMLEGVGGLDIPKYSKLSSMIYSELSDKSSSKEIKKSKPLLYDSRGQAISSDYTVYDKEGDERETGISKPVEAFFAGLNWLAFRTTLYTLAAKEFGVDLILHPIRNAFQVNLLSKMYAGDQSVFEPIIQSMNGIATSTVNRVIASTQPIVLKHTLPMFTVWLANKNGDPHKFIQTVYELRNEKPFVEARAQLIELEELIHNGNPKFIKKTNELIMEVQKQMKRICVRYGIETPQGVPISPVVSVWNMSTIMSGLPQVPKLSLDIKALDFLRDLIPKKGFAAVYKTIIEDLTQIGRLGKYHDIITSKINLESEAQYYNAKVEQRKYERYKSSWKIPM